MYEQVWFDWGAETDEIEVPKKSAETGGNPVRPKVTTNSCLKHLPKSGSIGHSARPYSNQLTH